MNTFGYQCPKCKAGDSLRIASRVWAVLTPDGTDNTDSDTEWDDESDAICGCGWDGKVRDLEAYDISTAS